jgi:hypothetical protein
MKLAKDLKTSVKFIMRLLTISVHAIHMTNISMITKYFLVIWISELIYHIMKFATWLCKKIIRNYKSTISFWIINIKSKFCKILKKECLILIQLINMIETVTYMIPLQKWECQHGVIEYWCAEIYNLKKIW